MPLNRRQFVQGSISAGVAATLAESPWLLRHTDQIRVGIAGLGDRGLTHLSLFASIPCVRIVTLCDRDPRRLKSALHLLDPVSRHPVTFHDSLEHLLDDPAVDAVSVTGEHLELTRVFRRAAATGKALLIDAPSHPLSWPNARTAALAASSSATLIRTHLGSHLDPGPLLTLSPESVAARLGSPVSFTLLARSLAPQSSSPLPPALACLQLLAAHLAPGGWSPDFDHQPPPRVSGNPAKRTLHVGDSCISVCSLLGSNAAPAALELSGPRGRALLLASRRSPIEASARIFLSFLSNSRQSNSDRNAPTEQALIATALATLIKSSSRP